MATLEQGVWVKRVLGVNLAAPDEAQPKAERPGASTVPAMAAWRKARASALASLKALENAFRKMQEPEVNAAIILLRAIAANLTETPATPAQVRELETYLRKDRIVREAEMPNGFGFKVSLRVPLLAALAALPHEHSAAEGSPDAR